MANTPTTNFAYNKPAEGDSDWDTTINGNWDLLDADLIAEHEADGTHGAITPTSINTAGNITVGGTVDGVDLADLAGRYNVGELMLYPHNGRPSTTTGCAVATQLEYGTNDVDIEHFAFDKDSDEFAQWTEVMPADWNAGTVTGTFWWTWAAGGSAAETVEWNLQGISYANSGAIDTAWGTAQPIIDTAITAGDVHVSDATPAITLAGGPAAGEVVQFRVSRDISDDNLACDALLIAVKVTYTKA